MGPIKISDRLKHYRNILDIGQKALVDENISINLIKYVEGGKRRLTVHKAIILADKFNAIAREKEVELNLTARDLLMTDEEYAQKICLDELHKIDEKVYDEEKYSQILNIAQDHNLNEVIINVYEKIGKYYYSIRDYNNAIKYYMEAFDLATKIDINDKKIQILNSLGVCYHLLGDYVKALELYDKCYNLLLNNDAKDNKLESKLLYNLALCYRKLKRESETSRYLEKLLLMTDFDEQPVINGMILKANICLEHEDHEGALQLYKAISTYGPKYMYIIQHNMAYAFVKLNRIDESIDYMTKAINNQLEDESPALTISLMNMASIYEIEKLYNPAIIFFEYAVDSSIKYKQTNFIAECGENLFMLYKKIDKVSKLKILTTKISGFINTNVVDEEQIGLLNKLIERYSEYINS